MAAELAHPGGHAGAHDADSGWVVRLANDIAVQFPHLGEAEAAESTAEHIRQFWDPRMVAELTSVAGRADVGLTDRAAAAARLVAARA